jgi:phosphoribosylformylglycinamidine synthase
MGVNTGPRVAVVVFPGSNCDRDALSALAELGVEADPVWHTVETLAGYDGVILPGGFSYGDYLRAGALAARSPVMGAVRRLADDGGRVLGICNGFQTLCEAGMLPGALTLNTSRRFHCVWSSLSVPEEGAGFLPGGDRLRLPIAHGEGCYRMGEGGWEALQTTHRVILQYAGADGSVEPRYALNGSDLNIAGVANRAGTIAGLMPHPERAMDARMGGADGRRFLGAWLGKEALR